MKQKVKLTFLSLLVIAAPAIADELLEVNTSVRALGMGNAYTSVVDNHDALFYNAAGLSKVSGINWTIFEIQAGANGQDVYDIYQDFQDTGSSSSAFATNVKKLFGKKIWLGAGGKTALTIPGFGIAAYDAMTASAYVSNPAFPNMNINFINDYGLATGFSFDAVPKILTVGLNGRRITRFGSSFPIGVSTLATLSSTQLQNQIDNRGTGYAVDYGMNLTIPTPVKPTFSFVWKNLGYTTFTQDAGSRPPPLIRDEMIGGFGLDFDLPGINIRPAMDFKYMNRTDIQLGKKVHFGIEFDLPLLAVRGGFSQGYYTAGVGVDLGVIKADAATYGVELGEYPGQHEDRRYVLQVSMELGFDPSFGFLKGGQGGKSRKGMKQRR